LELLAGYLSKWGKPNPNDSEKVCIAVHFIILRGVLTVRSETS
jgi:hypothetical protein